MPNRNAKSASRFAVARFAVARFAVALAVAALVLARSASAEVPKRTLAELLELARTRSPLVDNAEAQVDVRRAAYSEAWRNWLPSGDITFGISPSVPVNCLDSTGAINPNQCVETVSPNNAHTVAVPGLGDLSGVAGQLAIRLTQPIYTFGKIEHGMAAAKRGVEAEQSRVEAARRETDAGVARAYWGLKAARTSMATAVDAKADLDDYVKKIADDLELDKPKYVISDLQRIKVAVVNLEVVIAELERLTGIALAGLHAAVGEETDIDDTELEPDEIVSRPLDFYQEAAVRSRPEVRALNSGVDAYRELEKYQFSQMLPDIGLNLSLSYSFADGVPRPANVFMAQPNGGWGFGLSVGIRQPLDIFEREARWQHARADRKAFQAQQRLSMAGIGLEIAQAHSNLDESLKRLDTLDRGQRTARGWLNSVKQNIDVGTADPRDLVEAARNYYDLRLRYYQAIFDVNLNAAVLRRAAGVDVTK